MAITSGKLIAIEGIDGSGKGTQLELLQKSLRARGVAVHATNFPHYQSWFGTMVGQFLNGKFGALESVDPHFAALLYAVLLFTAVWAVDIGFRAGSWTDVRSFEAARIMGVTAIFLGFSSPSCFFVHLGDGSPGPGPKPVSSQRSRLGFSGGAASMRITP